MELLLASTSQYRRQLLERLGVSFRTRAPRVDEDAWKRRGLSPRQLAEELARAKATSLRDAEPDAVIIGCDQVATWDDQILGKPGTAALAANQLRQLSGRRHQLITAICVLHKQREWSHTDITTLEMRRLSADEIERYVACDEPFDCAGSYKLEQRGIALFHRIESADHTAITGLPLIALTSILREIGFSIP